MPATIAVLGGVPHVGLTAEQLQRIAEGGRAVWPRRPHSCTDVDGPPTVLLSALSDTGHRCTAHEHIMCTGIELKNSCPVR